VDSEFNRYDSMTYTKVEDEDECINLCSYFQNTGFLRGLEYTPAAEWCYCLFENDKLEDMDKPEDDAIVSTCNTGTGPATCMVSLSIILPPIGLSRYQELDSESGLIGFLSLRSIQNHCSKEKFFVSDFC